MDDDQTEVGTEQEVQPTENTQQETTTDDWNPLWEAMREDAALKVMLPRLQEKIKPQLDSYAQQRREELAKYEPYKEFAEKQISREDLIPAYNMYALARQNPQELYTRLGNMLGISPQEAQEVVEKAEEAEVEASEDSSRPNFEADPTYAAMQQQINDMQVAQHRKDLDDNLSKLAKKHETSDIGYIPIDNQEIVRSALDVIAQGQYPNWDKLYDGWANRVRAIRAVQPPGNRAPQIVASHGGGGHSLPIEDQSGVPDNFHTMKPSDRKAWLMTKYLPGLNRT